MPQYLTPDGEFITEVTPYAQFLTPGGSFITENTGLLTATGSAATGTPGTQYPGIRVAL